MQGWVSYAVTTLLASVGDARLMPLSREGPAVVVTTKSGYVRNNQSWIIDRILRDYDAWMDKSVRSRLDQILSERYEYMKKHTSRGELLPRPSQTGLCVSIYEPSLHKTAGDPTHDLTFWSGLVIAVIQLCVATIPIALSRSWGVLLVSAGGIALALLTGSLPQWKAEKWSCRRGATGTYVLTRGNGSQHAVVILGNGRGLHLEDLAMGDQVKDAPMMTRVLLCCLSILWICLLIAAAGLSEHTWFLLAVGSLGMFQNVLVAGWRSNPSALGVHLEYRAVVAEMSTMDTLLALEASYPRVGKSLLPIFFPGELRQGEIDAWNKIEQAASEEENDQKKEQINADAENGWIAHTRAVLMAQQAQLRE